MLIVVLMLFLIVTAWLFSGIFLFFPLSLFDWLQQGFWYLFLAFLIIAVSWLIGE